VPSLNVVMVTRRRPSARGGVERVVTSLVGALGRQRPAWRVDAVSASRQGGARTDRVPGLSDVVAGLRLGWRLRTSTADVIFLHCPECFWGIRLLRKRHRRRHPRPAVIAVWHGAGPRRFLVLRTPGHPLAHALAWLRTIQEVLALSADGHVAVHESVASDLRSVYGLDKPVTVAENAVDATILDQLAKSESDAGPDDDSGLTALWLGQTGYGKGLDVALAAVAEARRELPHLRLIVAGVPAGDNIEGVEWRGEVSPAEVTELYRQADLLIFPSRYEAFGLVVIEAMAAGLPVLVSDDVPAGIVTDGRNGVVITGHNPSRYAAALTDLADDAVRAAMSKAALEDVRCFSADSMTAAYVAVAESFAGIQ
jgi:glycosyltransferase involved in cell wall biosynthesis